MIVLEHIKIDSNITWEEVENHVNGISEEAHNILNISDQSLALDKLRMLRDFVESENHDLVASKNREIVYNSLPLRTYSFYSAHLHFIKFNRQNLSWNASEFDQAKIAFEMVKKTVNSNK